MVNDATITLLTRALLLAEVGNHCAPAEENHYTGPVCGVCDDEEKYGYGNLNERGHRDACLLDQALVAVGLDTREKRRAERPDGRAP